MGVKVPDSKSILPFPYLSVRVFAIDFSFSSKEDNLFFNKISCQYFNTLPFERDLYNFYIFIFEFEKLK